MPAYSTQQLTPARAGPLYKSKGDINGASSAFFYELPPQSELLILWAIRNGRHPGVYGLDIQRAIEESSGGNIKISVGTLYSMLKRLRGKGYITSIEGSAPAGGGNRQYYSLTDTGNAVVNFADDFIARLQDWQP
ncbi:PadR family transcriptional regulator [Nodosilinea sp. LEGE 06152]|nr:PadR family transcriptional regulator [Nodosilinea sp. LEGE 06152]